MTTTMGEQVRFRNGPKMIPIRPKVRLVLLTEREVRHRYSTLGFGIPGNPIVKEIKDGLRVEGRSDCRS